MEKNNKLKDATSIAKTHVWVSNQNQLLDQIYLIELYFETLSHKIV